ncbi:dolichyl-diphosphooligosaccharide-protein glycotransferase NDAI_0H03060 [Naumovozyma dairenensis CBS 421]|uniref:Ribophorin II C-terminal domain-containing protein n=1 Tax=Naumovozyma dairenensis (strain ATCC 10597 / BCRC 20456 / CBS 421 / NBRC 0211 / NRRL Y-12639) TaxID=1071378 RepID=G0WFB8_NAUDC|nr:hypothetical protein NDAI_0H03060 [Naumovozyma dairenensis CBS 421]CCD26479.1 hypothetical protein NDAI_0H03060 [Naumovozyma dairenensis CBS 421]
MQLFGKVSSFISLLLVQCIFLSQYVKGQAFQIDKASIEFPNSEEIDTIALGSIDSQFNKFDQPIEIHKSDEIIEFKFSLNNLEEQPAQVTLLFGLPQENLETTLYPTIQKNDSISEEEKPVFDYTFEIKIQDLDPILLTHSVHELKPLVSTLIVADESFESQDNLFVPIFDLFIVNNVIQDDNNKILNDPERLGAKEEIRYTFAESPKTVSPFLSYIFMGLITFATLVLLISWSSSGAIKFDNLPSGLDFIYFLVFLGAIVGFEYIFSKYYLGSTIFDTLHAAFYLGVLGLIVGTKFLRSVGKTI